MQTLFFDFFSILTMADGLWPMAGFLVDGSSISFWAAAIGVWPTLASGS